MPLYSFVSDDGEEYEHLCSYEDRPEQITIKGKVYKYSLSASAPARTALGWATFAWGVNGQYDANIKKKVNNVKELDAEYKSAGLIKLNPKEADDEMERMITQSAERTKKAKDTSKKLHDVMSCDTDAEKNKKWEEHFGEDEHNYILEKGKTIYEEHPELYDGSIRPKTKYS
jgi:hypothetical protein